MVPNKKISFKESKKANYLDAEKIGKLIIDLFNKNEFDYVQNLEPRTFPDGMDVEIFTFNSLEKAWQDAVLPSEREHVTSYFRNNEKTGSTLLLRY